MAASRSRLVAASAVAFLILLSFPSWTQQVHAKGAEATVLLLGVDGRPLPGVEFNYMMYFDERRFDKLSTTSDSDGLAKVTIIGPKAELYGFQDTLLDDISPEEGIVGIPSSVATLGQQDVEPFVIELPALRVNLTVTDAETGIPPPTVSLVSEGWARVFLSPFNGLTLLTVKEGSPMEIASPFRKTASATPTETEVNVYLEKTATLTVTVEAGTIDVLLKWEGVEGRDREEATYLVVAQLVNSEGRKETVELGSLESLGAKGEKRWRFEVPEGFEESLINVQAVMMSPWSLRGEVRIPALALEGYALIYPVERGEVKNRAQNGMPTQLMLYSVGVIALLGVSITVYLAWTMKRQRK